MAGRGPKSQTSPHADHHAAVVEKIPAVLAASARKPVAAKRAAVDAPPLPAPANVDAEAPAITDSSPAVAPAPAAFEKDMIMETSTATTDKPQEQAQAQAQALFADANGRARSAMEKGTKLLADINDFSKGNIEAVVESSKIAAKGAEDVARYTTDYAKAAVEKANATARQFAAVKSPTEFMKLQSEIAKDAVDSMMAETARFTESYLKLLGEVSQPISNRVALAAEKMKIAA